MSKPPVGPCRSLDVGPAHARENRETQCESVPVYYDQRLIDTGNSRCLFVRRNMAVNIYVVTRNRFGSYPLIIRPICNGRGRVGGGDEWRNL